MNSSKSDFLMIAKTMHGLEDVLIKELEKLGAKKITKQTRAVEFYGNEELLYKSNICLRTALRILKPIYFFKANNKDELYKKTKEIKWENHIKLNDTFIINSTISNSKSFNNNQFVSQKIKDAIADQFSEKYGRRPSINKYNPTIVINAHLKNNNCQISLDSSGESLHKRGYRIQKGQAPINEVLAAGILLLSDWNKNSTLKDPMCGSGTIIIEAGLIANNQAPNKKRKNFGFMNWPKYNEKTYLKIIEEIEKNEVKNLNKISGSDIHFGAISASRKNINEVNLNKSISLKRFDFFKQKKIHEKCHLIFNPPYGERLKIKNDNFYSDLGDILKKYFLDSAVWIITSDKDRAKLIGLKPSKKYKLYNGKLECHLLKFEIYSGSKK